MVGIGVIIVIQDQLLLFEPVDVVSRVIEGLEVFELGRRRGVDGRLLFQEVGFRNVISVVGSLRSHPAPSLLIDTGADPVLSQHATSDI
jgi:hypothetical protein